MRVLDMLRAKPVEARQTIDLSGYAQLWSQLYADQMLIPNTTMNAGEPEAAPDPSFTGYVNGLYKRNGVVFAAMAARQLVFQSAPFVWRQYGDGPRPGRIWTDAGLEILEQPWPKGTTSMLSGRAINDVDLAGNAFVALRRYRRRQSLKRMRPDWVTTVYGTPNELGPDDDPNSDLDLEIIGFLYHPGGRASGATPTVLSASEVVWWAPYHDPEERFRGMSPLTPVIREVLVDNDATTYKQKFYANSATPNLVVKLEIQDPQKFKEWVKLFREEHEGPNNAFRTLMLGAGGDATVVGNSFSDMDLKALSGLSETRIAAALGTHPVVIGLSEGLAGSALNAGNYQVARRRFADGTLHPLWESWCRSLGDVVPTPGDSELWINTSQIPFLQEDEEDAAKIRQADTQSIRTLVDGGFDPASAVEAVTTDDMTLLRHTGKLSVQLQPPGTGDDEPADDEAA